MHGLLAGNDMEIEMLKCGNQVESVYSHRIKAPKHSIEKTLLWIMLSLS